MASSETPSGQEISQVIDFAGLHPLEDLSMVVEALKENCGNVESVVMQYFDNPEGFRQRFTRSWNEGMFSADRDGSDSNTGISFHIESMGSSDIIQGVTPPPERRGPGAPSRPPSRSNDRSPLGIVVDWTAGGDGPGGSDAQSREDQDMQRALRESAQEAGIALPQQDSGVLDPTTPTPFFGPANRNEYDQDSWAMVANQTKVATAPAPVLRKRVPGAPAFLVQGHSLSGGHCLGGLLTILHEIPLARNILLAIGAPAASYGFNSEWWKGQEILPPHILAQLQSGDIQWGERHGASPNWQEEIHRLMAFLDSTERSYGAVSVLTDLIPFSSVGPEKRFYEHLVQRGGDQVSPLNQIATLANVFGDDEGEEEAKFSLLETEHPRAEYSNIKTLYESLDHVMWSDVLSWNEMTRYSKMAMFKHMGEVFTIKIGGDGPEDYIDIPEEFYPERYLPSRKDEARRIQRGWCETKKVAGTISRRKQEIHGLRDKCSHQLYDRGDMMQKVMGQWKAYGDYLEGVGHFRGMEDSGFDTHRYPDYRAAPCQLNREELCCREDIDELLQQAEEVLADMDKSNQALDGMLSRISARQRGLGKLLTAPDKAGRPKPMSCKKYVLCGIATPDDIVYVRQQRPEPDLIEFTGEPQARDQWWRLSYLPKEEQPVRAEKISIERALRQVWQETKIPLLVYATEKALDTPRAALSLPLDRFVRAENKAFRQELSRETSEAAEAAAAGMMDALSPSKRKRRADSVDSMDSNRASIGSDDRDGLDELEDMEDGAATEMADLSEPRRASAAAVPDETDVAQRALPSRQPARAEKTLATLTPNALPAEGGETTTAGHEARPRGPEMQERCRPPAFMAASPGQTLDRERAGTDTEVPDGQE